MNGELLTAFKPHAGRLVFGWVIISESRLLYIFLHFYASLMSAESGCGFQGDR